MRPSVTRPHWSYSSISQFLKCPLQFFFERVQKLPRKATSDAQVLGSSVHSALAVYHRKLQAEEPVTTQHVHQAYLSAWNEQSGDGQIIVSGVKSLADSRDLGLSLVDVYLKEPPPENIVAVESQMISPIANSQGDYLEKPILAVIDLITRQDDGTLQIGELKTSGRAYSESEVATSLQPSFYANALYEHTGSEPGVEFTVLVKTKVPKLQRIEAIRTTSDFGRLGNIIEAVERSIEAESFFPVESPLNCSGCGFFRECREWTGPGSSKSGELPILHFEEATPCLRR